MAAVGPRYEPPDDPPIFYTLPNADRHHELEGLIDLDHSRHRDLLRAQLRDEQERIDSAPSRLVAFTLAFFLGCTGAHKFYLGQVGWGVAYLLITVLGVVLSTLDGSLAFALAVPVLTVLSCLEGLAYLASTDRSFRKRFAR